MIDPPIVDDGAGRSMVDSISAAKRISNDLRFFAFAESDRLEKSKDSTNFAIQWNVTDEVAKLSLVGAYTDQRPMSPEENLGRSAITELRDSAFESWSELEIDSLLDADWRVDLESTLDRG